jgi:hypothetical protein
VNADQTTDGTTFVRDTAERYELGDTILIKQYDQKRTVQISKGANTLTDHAGRRDRRCRGGVAAAKQATPATSRRRERQRLDHRPGRSQDGVRPRSAARQDADRSSTAARRVRSIEAGDRDRRLVHRSSQGGERAARNTPAPGGGCKDEIKTTETGDAS